MVKRLFIILLVLALFSLACNLPFLDVSPTPTPMPIDIDDSESLIESLERAMDEARKTGRVNLVISEAQISSALSSKLVAQDNPYLSDPRVHLRDGKIQVTGNTVRQGVRLPVSIVLAPAIDDSGNLQLQVESANVGPFGVPTDWISALQSGMEGILLCQVDSLTSDIHIENITIDGGLMTITGRLN